MSTTLWPELFKNEQGRLDEGPSSRVTGKLSRVCASGCPKALHISLFFDGTNNNREWDTKNTSAPTHTNIARLYSAAVDKPEKGSYAYYIPGLGTPFPEIGETEFSQYGKAFAMGFGMRVAWGYTRVLNAIYMALTGERLLGPAEARALCEGMDLNDWSPINGVYLNSLHKRLSTLQRKNNRPGGRLNKAIEKIWINVFGFSRGAASARVFTNRLINKWAKDHKIAGAIDYQVNFLGLFDTVASVGLPDSATAVTDWDRLDGHWGWARDGALNVPDEVLHCAHFFSIHEQRMSFPLESIRVGNTYPGKHAVRTEVAYPGVHSDVGGGYFAGEQGKARQGDSSKLSQIPLHDMYIEALRAGVPLLLKDEMREVGRLVQDFAIHPSVVQAFNAWLGEVKRKKMRSVEEALQIGMAQLLAWRTLRADIDNRRDYIAAQEFFAHAPESEATKYGATYLEHELETLQKRKASALDAERHAYEIPEVAAMMAQNAAALDEQINDKQAEILHVTQGATKPGVTAGDLVTTDRTDLLEATEEFRLLLAYLRPKLRTHYQVAWSRPPGEALSFITPPNDRDAQTPHRFGLYLCVDRQKTSGRYRGGSRKVWIGPKQRILQMRAAKTSYQSVFDYLLEPRDHMLQFLLDHTDKDAATQLPKPVVHLLDNFVHDSRAWFRVPYFREYAPGGFGWPRTFFVGNDQRVRYMGVTPTRQSRIAQRKQEFNEELQRYTATLGGDISQWQVPLEAPPLDEMHALERPRPSMPKASTPIQTPPKIETQAPAIFNIPSPPLGQVIGRFPQF